MEPKFRGKIINALRKLSLSWKPKQAALNNAKVDSALYQCCICLCYMYDGSSDKNFKKLSSKYPDVEIRKEKPQADHVDPIVPIIKGWKWSWDDYINRMFVLEDGYQILCNSCHQEKTKEENEKRSALRSK